MLIYSLKLAGAHLTWASYSDINRLLALIVNNNLWICNLSKVLSLPKLVTEVYGRPVKVYLNKEIYVYNDSIVVMLKDIPNNIIGMTVYIDYVKYCKGMRILAYTSAKITNTEQNITIARISKDWRPGIYTVTIWLPVTRVQKLFAIANVVNSTVTKIFTRILNVTIPITITKILFMNRTETLIQFKTLEITKTKTVIRYRTVTNPITITKIVPTSITRYISITTTVPIYRYATTVTKYVPHYITIYAGTMTRYVTETVTKYYKYITVTKTKISTAYSYQYVYIPYNITMYKGTRTVTKTTTSTERIYATKTVISILKETLFRTLTETRVNTKTKTITFTITTPYSVSFINYIIAVTMIAAAVVIAKRIAG